MIGYLAVFNSIHGSPSFVFSDESITHCPNKIVEFSTKPGFNLFPEEKVTVSMIL